MTAGAERYRVNRARGIGDRAVALPMDGESTDAMAAAAELWFTRQYAVDGRPLSHQIQHNRPTAAQVRVGDATLTVRWTPRPNGRLIQALSAAARSTVYVLVVGADERDFWVAGWAYGRTLLAHTEDLGHGPVYSLRQDELKQNVDLMMAVTLGAERI